MKLLLQIFAPGKPAPLLAIFFIAVASVLAYCNTFSVPFIFDDDDSIRLNQTIRSLWPIGPVLKPIEGGATVAGRPILNLSFAVNYAIGGESLLGFHITNLLLHILASATLYAFLGKLLRAAVIRERFQGDPLSLAFWISLIWALHPIQTESVTYIAQRAESLAGLFYLLTLYFFARGVESPDKKPWLLASVAACAIGMGCKEIVASVPIIALLYDRIFVAGSFREAFRQRWSFHATMAATWLLLAYFILATNNRGNTAGLNLSISSFDYFKTQCFAILEYLRLTCWPHPLVLDYGTRISTSPSVFILSALVLSGMAIASLFAAFRGSAYGFLGVWFFAVLAPTSSFVPVVTQTMATHRMYLALAPVLTAALLLAYSRFGQKALFACAPIAFIFGTLTFIRNRDYQSEKSIWADTILKCPSNERALLNLSEIFVHEGKYSEAFALAEESLKMSPRNPKAHSLLAMSLFDMNRTDESLKHFQHALFLDPSNGFHYRNLGIALYELGRFEEAKRYLNEALRINPDSSFVRRVLEKISKGEKPGAGKFKYNQLPETGNQSGR